MRAQTPYRFSLIIPLERDRGWLEACLRRWIREQTFPRDRYEVLGVGCQASLRQHVKDIESLRTREDRLILHDQPHEVALCARGAREARGELLFFTESHVLPEADTLERADLAVRARPGVAGLSLRSVRVTSNRLSEAEADMFDDDIRYGMEQHPWRKILDQCYIAWRDPYFAAGGFRPEFGHFAEWLLAARMYQLGYRIGYAPEVELRHCYPGRVGELIEFAEDFARGEMRYHLEAGDDPCRSMFEEIPEWFDRHQWRADLARAAWYLAFGAWRRTAASVDWKATAQWLRFLLATAGRAAFGMRPTLNRASLRLLAARGTLPWRLRFSGGKTGVPAVVRLNEATVRLARLRFVARWLASRPPSAELPAPPSPWEPDRADGFPSFGFHGLERWQGLPFRWSEPVTMLDARLDAAVYELSIEWVPVRRVNDLTVYVDGRARRVTLDGSRGVVCFQQPSPEWARITWVCSPWGARRDGRFLGLPVRRVSWTACK